MKRSNQTLSLLCGLLFILGVIACDSPTAEQQEKVDTTTASVVSKEITKPIKSKKVDPNYAIKHIKEVLYPGGEFDELSADEQRYDHAWVDLNDDGKEETIFTIINMDYCGSGGCTLFILNSDGEFMGKVTVMDVPVGIGKGKSGGWRDLYVSSKRQDVVLQYGEGEYTTNASMAKEVTAEERKAGTEKVVLTKFAQ